MPYMTGQELYKDVFQGTLTLLKPSHNKLEPFAATIPVMEKLGTIIEPNEYISNPLRADALGDLPPYANEMMSPVNVTGDRINTFMFHWRLRLFFKKLKKELTERMNAGESKESIKARVKEFSEFKDNALMEEKLKSINVSERREELPKYLIHSKDEELALYEYWKLVFSQRPTFPKHVEDEVNYDFDFPVEAENYDPWSEYKLIYRDAFTKGRTHWLLKAMPEWYFLQIGRPQGKDFTNVNQYNVHRPNMNDSIFNILTVERYFDERREKMNITVRDSHSIRI